MGPCYVNHTVCAPQDRVAAFLQQEGRTAFVSPTVHGYTVVCDRQCDSQDAVAIGRLGQRLSLQLACPVLAVLNHEDDLLCYWLFEHGRLIDEQDAFPEFVDDDSDLDGFGAFDEADRWKVEGDSDEESVRVGAAEELCRVFGRPAMREQVQTILAGREALFALQIHQELVDALGLPGWAVGAGYTYVARRQTELDRDACIHVTCPTGWQGKAAWGGEG